MILYMDASALVKRYIEEAGSDQVSDWINNADMIATSIISRTEVVAALSRAFRMKIITEEGAQKAISLFHSEWESIPRLPVTEMTVARGDNLAWQLGLRGYDAIHLASAIILQEEINSPITMFTFDRQLWEAAKTVGLGTLPNTK
jgi:predicted nucleic acid-binding protein